MRYLDCRTDSWISGVLADRTAVVGETHAAIKAQPACGFVLLFREYSFAVGPWNCSGRGNGSGSARRTGPNRIELVIPLPKYLHTSMEIVTTRTDPDCADAAEII